MEAVYPATSSPLSDNMWSSNNILLSYIMKGQIDTYRQVTGIYMH